MAVHELSSDLFKKILEIYDSNHKRKTKIKALLDLKKEHNLKNTVFLKFMEKIVYEAEYASRSQCYEVTFDLLEYCFKRNRWSYLKYKGKIILLECIFAMDRVIVMDYTHTTCNRNLKNRLITILKKREKFVFSIRRIWLLIGLLVFQLNFSIIDSLPIFYDPNDHEDSQKYLNLYIAAIGCCGFLILACSSIALYDSFISPINEYDRDMLLNKEI